MRPTLVILSGLLGLLVGVLFAWLGALYLGWMRRRLHWIARRMLRRVSLAFAVVLLVPLPLKASGIDLSAAADKTPGVAYLLGLAAGIVGAVVARRRAARQREGIGSNHSEP